jgi:hypothetical protein
MALTTKQYNRYCQITGHEPVHSATIEALMEHIVMLEKLVSPKARKGIK